MQIPFWEMTYKNEKGVCTWLNQKEILSSRTYKRQKGIYSRRSAETLRDLKENIAGKEM